MDGISGISSGIGGVGSSGGIDLSYYQRVQAQTMQLVQFQAEIGVEAAEVQATSGAINMAVRALQTAASNVRA